MQSSYLFQLNWLFLARFLITFASEIATTFRNMHIFSKIILAIRSMVNGLNTAPPINHYYIEIFWKINYFCIFAFRCSAFTAAMWIVSSILSKMSQKNKINNFCNNSNKKCEKECRTNLMSACDWEFNWQILWIRANKYEWTFWFAVWVNRTIFFLR